MRRLFLLLGLLTVTYGSTHAQWTLENSTTTADLRGIDNVGGGIAWASGTNGTVVRTEDGGYLWQPCTIPPGAEHLDFRGIQAFDANTAIVMSSGKGDLSRLYKTTDGCQTWKLILRNPDKDGFWDAMRFSDHDFGVLVGDPVDGRFYARLTTDGGKRWQRFRNDDPLKVTEPNAGIFAASNSALLLASNPIIILLAANVGKTARLYEAAFAKACAPGYSGPPANCGSGYEWQFPIELDLKIGDETSGAFSLAYLFDQDWNPGTGIAVGGDYKEPDASAETAAFCSDEIVNWDRPQTPPHGFRSAVAYDATTKTWITVGPNGTDISADDGRNWRALHPNPALRETPDADSNWNALSLPFVVGPHGRIGKLDAAALTPAAPAAKSATP